MTPLMWRTSVTPRAVSSAGPMTDTDSGIRSTRSETFWAVTTISAESGVAPASEVEPVPTIGA